MKILFGAAAVIAVIALVAAMTQYHNARQLAASLSAAQSQVSQLQQQLAQASAQSKEQLAELQQQSDKLQRAATVLRTEAKPDLPVTIWFSKNVVGPGISVRLRNNSGVDLEVAAALESNATGQTQQRVLTLSPQVILVVAGWVAEPGQRVSLTNVNYRPVEYVVPATR